MKKETTKIDIESVKEFISKNNDKIINLFIDYQIIELLLYLHLSFPDPTLKKLNKGINNKTFGKIIKKYNRKFPKDELKLKKLMIDVSVQRNSFMHSLWLTLALLNNKKRMFRYGKQIIDNYVNVSDRLLKKIYESDFD